MYKTETKYTYEEFKKYENEMYKKKVFKGIGNFVVILVLMSIFLYYLSKNLTYPIGMLVLICTLFFFKNKACNKMIDKMWNTTPDIHDMDLKFTFLENELEIITEKSNSKLKYEHIYKVVETDTNFYILRGMNMGYIIVKNNCNAELVDFIRNLKKKN